MLMAKIGKVEKNIRKKTQISFDFNPKKEPLQHLYEVSFLLGSKSNWYRFSVLDITSVVVGQYKELHF